MYVCIVLPNITESPHERESGLGNPENFYLTESGILQYLLLNPESLVLEIRNTF